MYFKIACPDSTSHMSATPSEGDSNTQSVVKKHRMRSGVFNRKKRGNKEIRRERDRERERERGRERERDERGGGKGSPAEAAPTRAGPLRVCATSQIPSL